MELIPDTVDLSLYMQQPDDCSAKVRPACVFAADLIDEFKPKGVTRQPHMFSTKLRDVMDFRPGEVTAWAGYNGHRKSMFTGQVALDLCVQGQRTMIASLEMAPQRTLARMVRQASAVSSPSEALLSRFSEWTKGRLWLFDHLGRISPETMLAACRYFAAEKDGRQVLIDSMMMVCASEESLDEQKQFMTDLVRLAQETGLHVHLVTHCRKPGTNGGEDKPPTKYDLRGSAAISDQAHNVITVWANKAKRAALDKDPMDSAAQAEPDALVTVEKQRNGEWEGRAKLWFHAPSLRFLDDRVSPCEPYVLREAA